MYIFGYFFTTIAKLLHLAFQIAIVVFIIRAILSWIQPDPRQPVVAFLYRVTDPVLNYIRRFIPPIGTIDVSPLVVLIVVWFLDNFLVPVLMTMGSNLLN